MYARRLFAPVVLALLTALVCLCPNAGSRIAPWGGSAATIAHAQSEPELVVFLYGNTLTFRTVPLTAVSAELAGADGVKKDEGIGVAGADGVATVQFVLSGAGIRPGDTLTLSRAGGKPLRVTVPALSAWFDVDQDRVNGSGPAGASLQVTVSTSGTAAKTVERTVATDATGGFGLDLASEFDLLQGNATGTVSFTSAANHRFVSQFVSPSASLTIGARSLRGQASPGTTVRATIYYAGGATQDVGPTEVTGGTAFELSLVGQGAGAAGQPIGVGDTVNISFTGGPAGSDQVLATGSLIPLTIALNPLTETIAGTGPAGRPLRLSADSMDGQTAAFDATIDALGAFALSVGDRINLGAGWRVRASYEVAPGVRVGALAVLRKVRVGVGFLSGQGRAEPGQPVTVTLRSSGGTVKMQQRTFVNDQGTYNLFGGGGFGPPGLSPMAGDAIEIAFVDGDPDVLRVPALSARTDVTANTVSGEAPAGASVRVRVETGPAPASMTTTADASGTYRAVLADPLKMARPMNGSVFVSPTEGAEFYTTWAAVQLTVNGGNTFNSNFIIGNGPLGRTITAELFTPDGKLIGQASGPVFGGNAFFVGPGGGAQPQFFLQLTDTTGTQITMKPGDTLKVTAGDDAFELVIPPLDAVVFVQNDTVNGHTLPSGKVKLQIAADPTGGISAEADATADAAGNFSHSFDGVWDVKYGDFVLLSVDVGGHLVLNTSIAPGMLVDADQAVVLASLAPNVQAIVALKRAGKTVASQTTGADDSGALMAALTDAAGEPVVLQAGDELSVTPAKPGVDPLTLVVPDLTVQADAAIDAIGGRATVGGSLTMLATDTYSRQGTIGLFQAWPSVEANGTYAADFVPRVDVRPGTRVFALYRPAAGHYVVRTRTVPILNAEHSGPSACGFGEVRQNVSIDVADGQSRHAADAATRARFDGFFNTALRDAAKNLFATAENQTEMARLGGPTADIRMPTLDAQVDWQRRAVTGRGPASTTFFVRPAVPCSEQAPQGVLNVNVQFAFPQATGADGAFQAQVPGQVGQPGSGLEIAFYAPNEHRYFRTIYRAMAQVYIHADRVGGRANGLENVTVVVKAADGAERGRATVKADADGRFDARLAGPSGAALTINAGDVVSVQTAAETPSVTVEPLAFDWSPGAGELAGTAPAGRTVRVLLRLKSGAVYAMPRTADSGGTFRLAAADVPPRADWTWADVAAVRIVMSTAGGHEVIDQTADFETEAGPGDDRATVFLPIGYSNRRAPAMVVQAGAAAGHAARRPVAPTTRMTVRDRDPQALRSSWRGATSLLLRGAPASWAEAPPKGDGVRSEPFDVR